MTLTLDSFHCSKISHNSIQFYSAFRHWILSLIQNLPLIRIQSQYLPLCLLLLWLLTPILPSGASCWIILLSICTINHKNSSHLANPLETGHDPDQLTLMRINVYLLKPGTELTNLVYFKNNPIHTYFYQLDHQQKLLRTPARQSGSRVCFLNHCVMMPFMGQSVHSISN